MALTGHVKAFGLRDVKLTDISGTLQVDLPSAQTIMVRERLRSGELSGDDALQAVVAFSEAVEWELGAGGISLESYALMTGRTVALTGTGATEINTLTIDSQETFPYFKIYGKSLGDSTDDVHVQLFKAKLTGAPEGTFQDSEFYVMSCSGLAIDDGSNGIMDIVQNETATDLPSS